MERGRDYDSSTLGWNNPVWLRRVILGLPLKSLSRSKLGVRNDKFPFLPLCMYIRELTSPSPKYQENRNL